MSAILSYYPSILAYSFGGILVLRAKFVLKCHIILLALPMVRGTLAEQVSLLWQMLLIGWCGIYSFLLSATCVAFTRS